MSSIKAIFFDFDDTLGNREYYAYDCYRAILKENTDIEDPVEFEAVVQDCMLWDEKGNINKTHVKDRLAARYGIRLPYDDFNVYWDSVLWKYTQAYEETRDVLTQLKKKYQIGIITNGPSDGQRNKLRQSGLADLFAEDHIIVSGDHPFAKPDPRLFLAACEKLGVQPCEAVHVGDIYARDVLGAYRAGMTPVWIWTQGDRKNHSGVRKIHSLRELLEIY